MPDLPATIPAGALCANPACTRPATRLAPFWRSSPWPLTHLDGYWALLLCDACDQQPDPQEHP